MNQRGKKPGTATNGEDINADTSTGRTCLGECGTWKSKEQFRIVLRTNNLRAYCTDCEKKRNREQWHTQKSVPGHKEKRYEQNQAHRQRLKLDVLENYGGHCVCCGENQPEFLTLDHVDGKGVEHRKMNKLTTGATSTWSWARKNNYPDVLRLLCWNCNSARGAYGYCPHAPGMNRRMTQYAYGRVS